MEILPLSLRKRLQERIDQGNYRQLKQYSSTATDFFSNDYLGLNQNKAFEQCLLDTVYANPKLLGGSTGSRLISGNSQIVEDVEQYIAEVHSVEEALLFGSGYQANLALFGNLPTPRDTIIVDEYIHRSVHDGCTLSRARKWKFKHNDLLDLERLLQQATGEVYVAIESLYSMDGDLAPLEKIIALTQRYGAFLIVDEAHAIGVYGLGRVSELGLYPQIFATVITYGKAMGVHGASVLGSVALKSALVNFGSPFIYSTSPSPLMAVSIRVAYEFILTHKDLQEKLQGVIHTYQSLAPKGMSITASPIQTIRLNKVNNVTDLMTDLQKATINVCVIRPPTVAVGTERLRICLHAFNTQEEIIQLFQIIKQHNGTH
ncbi:pyridoxal phosphate-dependent aminotransferase family protein [Myroides sp. N17-2]|uniref:aminotransferase class I/II-fold pyridoxal phosphate-dependent enzyme n=1 Tax=Myroides sp. N17-2 TaxID=2030799 RepID=UPI000EFB71FB|nr:pyridoxal phosphate-dependent aminotransferase family protein [Myroides sp. N17-2]